MLQCLRWPSTKPLWTSGASEWASALYGSMGGIVQCESSATVAGDKAHRAGLVTALLLTQMRMAAAESLAVVLL